MSSAEILVILAAVALAGGIGAGLALLLRRRAGADDGRQADMPRLAQLAETLAATQNQLAGRLNQLADTTATAQAELGRTVAERLDAVSKQLGDSLTQSADRTSRTIGELQTRLAVIDEAQKGLSALSSQVIGLQDILDNKQARGAFGEQILENLVRDALPEGIFEFQATLSNRSRVDCLIRLPNPPGPIAIDAKFPLESYRALADAADDAARTLAARAFTADMQKHIADIAGKYILPGETAESALLFLPSEAVFAELHSRFSAVVEAAQRRRVWIVSPTTMMATLTTIRAVLRDARMREQAGEIQRQVTALTEDVGRLLDRVGSLRKHFGQAEQDIRQIEISADKVARKTDQVGAVQLEAPDTAQPAAAATGARPRLIGP
ncbi:MAG TPA: DNA recombination protein RmuC [Candidatus Sulfotelmatobacter sp.]|nr:DNA recombination protein RmuC [Candidatus Sulfotelmatobacter sp.]